MQNKLQHYASPYYDPVKAHEYYMRNRELKGRRLSSKLSDEGKKTWSYTKKAISEEKKNKVVNEQEKRKQTIASLREKASVTRANITEKLKALNAALTEKATKRKERVTSRTATAIERLLDEEIPSGLSKEAEARFIEKRKLKIARLRSDASAEKQEVTTETKEERASNRLSASEERKQVATELKSAISAAREAYKQAKASLDSSYEEIFQREFDKILAEMPKIYKRKRKSS